MVRLGLGYKGIAAGVVRGDFQKSKRHYVTPAPFS